MAMESVNSEMLHMGDHPQPESEQQAKSPIASTAYPRSSPAIDLTGEDGADDADRPALASVNTNDNLAATLSIISMVMGEPDLAQKGKRQRQASLSNSNGNEEEPRKRTRWAAHTRSRSNLGTAVSPRNESPIPLVHSDIAGVPSPRAKRTRRPSKKWLESQNAGTDGEDDTLVQLPTSPSRPTDNSGRDYAEISDPSVLKSLLAKVEQERDESHERLRREQAASKQLAAELLLLKARTFEATDDNLARTTKGWSPGHTIDEDRAQQPQNAHKPSGSVESSHQETGLAILSSTVNTLITVNDGVDQEHEALGDQTGAQPPATSSPTAFEAVKATYDVVRAAWPETLPKLQAVYLPLLHLPVVRQLVHRRRGEAFRLGRSTMRSLRAALCQVSGAEPLVACDNCRAGDGLWDRCVVSPASAESDYLGRRCANCFYNGLGGMCTWTAAGGIYTLPSSAQSPDSQKESAGAGPELNTELMEGPQEKNGSSSKSDTQHQHGHLSLRNIEMHKTPKQIREPRPTGEELGFLVAQNVKLSTEKAELAKEEKGLRNEVCKLNAQNMVLTRQKSWAMIALAVLKRLRKKEEHLSARIVQGLEKQLREEHTISQRAKSDLEKTESRQCAKISSLESEKLDLENRFDRERRQADSVLEKIEDDHILETKALREKAQGLEADLAEMQERIAQLEAEVAGKKDLQDQVNVVKDTLKKAQEDSTAKEKALEEKVASLEADLSHLQNVDREKRKLEAEKTERNHQIKELKAKVASLTKEVAHEAKASKITLQGVEAVQSEERRRLHDLHARDVQEKVKAGETALQVELAKHTEELRGLEAKVKSLSEALKTKEQEEKRLQNQLRAVITAGTRYREEAFREASMKYTSDKELLETEMRELKKDIETKFKQNNELQNRLRNAEDEVVSLGIEVQSYKTALDKLKAQHTTEISQLEAQNRELSVLRDKALAERIEVEAEKEARLNEASATAGVAAKEHKDAIQRMEGRIKILNEQLKMAENVRLEIQKAGNEKISELETTRRQLEDKLRLQEANEEVVLGVNTEYLRTVDSLRHRLQQLEVDYSEGKEYQQRAEEFMNCVRSQLNRRIEDQVLAEPDDETAAESRVTMEKLQKMLTLKLDVIEGELNWYRKSLDEEYARRRTAEDYLKLCLTS
ncbi:Cingulin-like protein 1 [Cytospora mali]|uniref:Cingulin-like protein 1 n=1 Tax=Cytospora mali TaxID=578113 RepID=A0A194UWG6_CYTMA|nr:Cingulin-like protein 1 [Valsa mali var. pyri (nom. inval.)]